MFRIWSEGASHLRRCRGEVSGFRACIAVLSISVAGCTDFFGPSLPTGAVPLSPVPAEYEAWWALTQQCSGLRSDLSEVRWYTVPGSRTVPGHDEAAGIYIRGSAQVVLAEGQERNGFLVRHEMLHALRRNGGHPRDLFLEQCGGVVSCGDVCQEEAGPTPSWDLSVPSATPSEVAVEVAVVPDVVSLGGGSRGCVTIVATVASARASAVTLDIRRGSGFSWWVEGLGGGSGGGPVLRDSLIVIKPSGSWSYVFDCPRLIAEGLAPGDYTAYARLEAARSASVPFRVVP